MDIGRGEQISGSGTSGRNARSECRSKAGAAETPSAPTRVVVWSGASSNNEFSYNVRDGGRLLARDIWYEGAPAGFMRCTGSGTFTLHGAEIATGDPNHGGTGIGRPAIDMDGFRGRLTFLATTMAEPSEQLVVSRGDAGTKVLMIGQGNRDDFLVNRSPAARAALIQSVKYTPGGGAVPVPDRGTADAAFLREMPAQTREERPHPSAPVPAGAADLQLYRVSVTNATVCVRVSP